MKNLSRWFMLSMLVAALGLFGCEGDDGKDGQDFQLTQGEYVGLINCTACHAGTALVDAYAESAHLNQGSHTADSCATACHNPLGDNLDANAAFGVSTPNAVGCESCHGPGSGHFGVEAIPVAAPRDDVCGQCHTTLPSGHIPHHPFADEITERFQTSRHANQHARTGFCSACHSHEGGVALLSQPRLTSLDDLLSNYTPDTVPGIYMLPEGSSTIEGVTTKTCATCHDSHAAGLRGEGDITAEMMGMLPANPTTTEAASVVYSAEFNLCTTCHMVDLDVEPAPADGHFVLTDDGQANNGKLVFNYALSGAYLLEQVGGTNATYEFDLPQEDGSLRTREFYPSQVFYHDGASGDGRTFVDTHFGGGITSTLVEFDGSSDPLTLQGYNINAGDANACTICHDPHTGGKMLSMTDGVATDYPDNNENFAVGYAEGLGEFHTEYQGTAAYRQTGCTPCHTGDLSYSELIEGLPLAQVGNHWDVLGCRGCHDLAQANAAPADNNAPAFAMVKQFPATYNFAFNSGVPVANDALGSTQICFECHKGRTAALTPAEEAAVVNEYKDDLDGDGTDETYVGTENRTYAYLHYAPSAATLFGDESQMVPTYNTATYNGRFVHLGGAVDQPTPVWGCAACHNVHDTDGNNVVQNKMATNTSCNGCHSELGSIGPSFLKDRTEQFSVRLLETILTYYEAADGTTDLYPPLQDFITVLLGSFPYTDDRVDGASNPDPVIDEFGAVYATPEEALAVWLEGRTKVGPSPEVAKASTIWKIFTYEDGAPDGPFGVHGHGGSWAHNSVFARQAMYDAIDDLGGDLTGLPVVPNRMTVEPVSN